MAKGTISITLLLLSLLSFACSATTTKTVSAATCQTLTHSGPITVTKEGQIIENLDIYTVPTTYKPRLRTTNKWIPIAGINCNNFANIVIRNVRINHYPQGPDAIVGSPEARVWDNFLSSGKRRSLLNGRRRLNPTQALANKAMAAKANTTTTPCSQGIRLKNCANATIKNARIYLVNPPKSALANMNNYNIYALGSDNLKISNVILSGGSSGMWIGTSNNLIAKNWASYNNHGPYPRGQCIQIANSANAVIENFICKNQWMYSFPEDCISIWRSKNATVRNGVIAGNSATSGAAIQFEQSSILIASWGIAENVQAFGIGGPCFATNGGTNIKFINVGCRDHHCVGVNNRPVGNRYGFIANWENPSNKLNCCASKNISCTGCQFFNECRNPRLYTNLKYNPDAWTGKDIKRNDFNVNEYPIELNLCFSIGGNKWLASTSAGTAAANIGNIGLFGDGSIDYGSSVKLNTVNSYGACTSKCYTAWFKANLTWIQKCATKICNMCIECDKLWGNNEE